MKYDYICRNKDCKNHDKIFEVNQKMSDNKLKKCEICEKETLERLITTAAPVSYSGLNWMSKGGSY